MASQGTSPSSNEEIKTNIQQNIERKQDPDEQLLEEALKAANAERASGAGPSNQPGQKAGPGKGRLRKMREENTRRGEEFDTELARLLGQGLASARNVLHTSNRLREQMGPATRPQNDEGPINSFLATAESSLALANTILSAL